MPMERHKHKCKLCSRTFSNGRALGGHMKAHLASLPLPRKTHQVSEIAEPALSSSSSSGEEREIEEEEVKAQRHREAEEKALVYELRENPKKSFKLADPEFSFTVDAESVIQDRESETESKNPTRQRPKRSGKFGTGESQREKQRKPTSSPESPNEPEQLSSVSDTSPEENVAMCLMMLSRDMWIRNTKEQGPPTKEEEEEKGKEAFKSKGLEDAKFIRVRGRHWCENCKKTFRSSRALLGHKKICLLDEEEDAAIKRGNDRVFECPYCYKVFGSGQALGGHKRSHLVMMTTSSSSPTLVTANSAKLKEGIIDLNLPAPEEEEEFSGVSIA